MARDRLSLVQGRKELTKDGVDGKYDFHGPMDCVVRFELQHCKKHNDPRVVFFIERKLSTFITVLTGRETERYEMRGRCVRHRWYHRMFKITEKDLILREIKKAHKWLQKEADEWKREQEQKERTAALLEDL